MKTKNILMIFVCTVLAAFVLRAAGVMHLADTSAEEVVSADRLIGVLITREYLDLFDGEQFLNDNIGRLANGEKSVGQTAQNTGESFMPPSSRRVLQTMRQRKLPAIKSMFLKG